MLQYFVSFEEKGGGAVSRYDLLISPKKIKTDTILQYFVSFEEKGGVVSRYDLLISQKKSRQIPFCNTLYLLRMGWGLLAAMIT